MERLIALDPDVARWDQDFLDGVWRERLNLWSPVRIQLRPYGSPHGTRTVSPGKAIIRFTNISLGLIGELDKTRECERV